MSLQAYREQCAAAPYYLKDSGMVRIDAEPDGRYRILCIPTHEERKKGGRLMYENNLMDAMHWAEGWFRHRGNRAMADKINTDRVAMNQGQDTIYAFDLHLNYRNCKRVISHRGSVIHERVVHNECPYCKRTWLKSEVVLQQCRGCGYPSDEAFMNRDRDLQTERNIREVIEFIKSKEQ